jgi:molecular chaperone HscB
MFNVIGLNEFAGLANANTHCWLCHKAASLRAIFCHHCGTIQPVRDIDHFARLGIERRIDLDLELLDHQYAALSRTLDPQRFMIRGIGERGNAANQLQALTDAYETLRDPLRRGRYWLTLNEKESKNSPDPKPLVVQLKQQLDSAVEPMQCDRIAQMAGQEMENGVMGLLQALRGEKWQEANETLADLHSLESILDVVRERRAELMVKI